MEKEKAIRITVQTAVNAPIEKVWKQFNSPEHVTKWYFASDDWHAPFSESDFKEGGKSKTRMEAKDGSFGFDFEWIYTKIIELKFVHYTLADGREVFIDFEKTDKGVQITETFDAESVNSIELQKGGWQAILDNFKKYCEQN